MSRFPIYIQHRGEADKCRLT